MEGRELGKVFLGVFVWFLGFFYLELRMFRGKLGVEGLVIV